jgi:5-methylcytosine-specific restriction endonuclease McrA
MRNDIIEKKEIILSMIKNNESKSNICKFLECKPETLNSYLKKLGITYNGNQGLKGKKTSNRKSNVLDYIKKDVVVTSKLRNLLINDGIKEKKCECCKLDEWMEKPIPLELHHIDGNRFNNKLDNLRILCSNCHMQEHNYSNVKKSNKLKSKIKTEKIKVEKTCDCGKEINLKSKMCEKCWSIKNRKVNRPPFNQLFSEVTELGYLGTGRKYGVSDNTIRKWLTTFE